MQLSFHHRVVLLLSALVLILQIVNLTAVLSHFRDDATEHLQSELIAGAEAVSQIATSRSAMLKNSAEDLASDLRFRFAIASKDKSTIRSILDSKLNPSDVTLALYIPAYGRSISSSQTPNQSADPFQTLLTQLSSDGNAFDTLVLEGVATQVVAIQIPGPTSYGWLVLGARLSKKVAQRFSEQVSMDVSFAYKQQQYEFTGSTLSTAEQLLLSDAIENLRHGDYGRTIDFDDKQYLIRIVPLSSDLTSVFVILHSSLDKAMQKYDHLRLNLLSYMGVSLGIVLALGFWFARGVTHPIKLLAQAARRIRKGDYDIALDNSLDSHRGDELGELVSVFGDMQAGIANREERILHLAHFDDLTKLPNYRYARDRLHTLVTAKPAEHYTVIYLGLNQYRQIIDTLGQSLGDAVVLAVSERLQRGVSDSQLVARVSTDEFLLVLALKDDPELEAYVQAMLAELARPITYANAEMLPDLRAGIAVIPDDAQTANDAMRRAGIALGEAREKHISVCRYTDGYDESQQRSLTIVAELKKAVEQDELVLHYQPKLNMITGEVESVEALVRWIHPKHGFMAPDEFIGLAECSGYIGILTHWVLNTAISQLRQWHEQNIPLKVAVNLSALDLQNEGLFSAIGQLLSYHDVPTSQLIIEVTESAMLKDAEQALATLREMRAHGLTISIDDFGTGYSSLSKLRELPIDELKIDRAFVTNIEPDTVEAHIVQAIVDLGHSVGLTVIAEGVETEEEWNLLAKLGNDVVQGYYISRPLTAFDLTAWWNDRYPNNAVRAA